MKRQIKIKLVDFDDEKTKFQLEDDAYRGDYFFIEDAINDLAKIDQKFFYRKLKITEEQFIKNKENEIAPQIIDKFKRSNEFLGLQQENFKLKNNLENNKKNLEILKENFRREIEDQKNQEIAQLREQIAALNNEIKNSEENKKVNIEKSVAEIKLRLANDYQKQFNDRIEELRNKDIKEFEEKLNKNTNERLAPLREEWERIRNELNSKINEDAKHIKELETALQSRANWGRNIQAIGQDLEQYVKDEFEKYFPFANEQHNQPKLTPQKIHEEGRADFLFECFDDEKKRSLSAVIECKTESELSGSRTKNSDHYNQVLRDAEKLKTDYAILVTELEKERNFSILEVVPEKIHQAKIKLFIMRPNFLIPFLQLMTKINEIKKKYNKKNSKFELVENFDAKFQEFKDSILKNQIRHITSEFDDIEKQTNTIITSAKKIQEESLERIKSKFIQITKKFNDFEPKVKKYINNLEKNNITNKSFNNSEEE
ncbi:hypothetical protein J2Z62_000312 [Mycoplasmoides fastidiosum]|uniref:DUF2130 domain-containing protein n=1 Tax=Mycoplasmoides fastidiosum TaxID=92758 RepID=A0ABU0LYT5_9BACT|nr:DUF2130 domain-containing protein [Mycoplasmoides fastidiosum]MDQ0513874.1 hypothetical protein [Mycoplasmoides fastidiosum]UUD37712.1 DUF2130 domain-containing protein [Mycoplasmoides fastidiosum]